MRFFIRFNALDHIFTCAFSVWSIVFNMELLMLCMQFIFIAPSKIFIQFKLLWEDFELQSCLLYWYYFIYVLFTILNLSYRYYWSVNIYFSKYQQYVFMFLFISIFCLFFIRTKKVVLIEIWILHFATQNSWFWI